MLLSSLKLSQFLSSDMWPVYSLSCSHSVSVSLSMCLGSFYTQDAAFLDDGSSCVYFYPWPYLLCQFFPFRSICPLILNIFFNYVFDGFFCLCFYLLEHLWLGFLLCWAALLIFLFSCLITFLSYFLEDFLKYVSQPNYQGFHLCCHLKTIFFKRGIVISLMLYFHDSLFLFHACNIFSGGINNRLLRFLVFWFVLSIQSHCHI